MVTEFQTEHLLLRVLSPDWALPVLEFYKNNCDRFEPWEPDRANDFYTLDYQKRILYYDYLSYQKGSLFRFWFFLKEEPFRPIGTVSFHNIIRGVFQSCSIGYKIDRNYTHNGYTLEAVKSTMLLIFTKHKLHRIEALVHVNNTASLHFIEKAGFQREGIRTSYAKLNGTWHDHVCYSFINPFDPV